VILYLACNIGKNYACGDTEGMTRFQAKFYVWQILETAGFDGINLVLRPVLNDEVNKSFAKYTPGGEIQITIANPNLIDKFETHQEFIITFEELVKAPA
jgi:hypothetical protein